MTNWDPDINRFHLPAPPAWFLSMLWDFDAGLVIVPSRTRRNTYVLARRRLFSAAFLPKNQDVITRSRGTDADMLLTRGLVFVDTIGGIYGGTWNPGIIQQLRERDTWAVGGGEQYAGNADAADRAVEAKKKQQLQENHAYRANDGWRSYQARTGQRSRPTIPPVSKVSSSRTAGSGIIITG